MKGSGGWSDSLTCSIGGCRCRRGYRGGRSGISCRSSPLLLLAQRGLFPCLPQPMLLLQFQSETRIVARLIKKKKKKIRERKRERKSFLIKNFRNMVDNIHRIKHQKFLPYLSCITGDMSPRDAGGNMSGLYLSPYRGYEGNPGNNGGLSIPHRSKYNCSSNLVIENETFIIIR